MQFINCSPSSFETQCIALNSSDTVDMGNSIPMGWKLHTALLQPMLRVGIIKGILPQCTADIEQIEMNAVLRVSALKAQLLNSHQPVMSLQRAGA